MTDIQIKILIVLNNNHVRLSTNWDAVDNVKDGFLSLEKTGHIVRKCRRWYITDKGEKALMEQDTLYMPRESEDKNDILGTYADVLCPFCTAVLLSCCDVIIDENGEEQDIVYHCERCKVDFDWSMEQIR